MTTRPYELLARFSPNGSVAGVSVRTITTVNGRDFENDPVPLSGASDPAFTAFASQFAAGAVAERDTLQSSLVTMTADRDAQKAIADTVPVLNEQIQSLTTDKSDLTSQVATLTAERDALQSQVDTIPGLNEQIESLTAEKAELEAEVARLTALVPPPVPDVFLSADWPRFRNLILSDPAVQRVATGNPTAWPLMVLYLAQLSSTPSRGADIAQLWTMLEANTPVTPEEVARINAIAAECGVPLRMNEDGSIG